jgi:16S rRNA G966 N2-methylase RsmD
VDRRSPVAFVPAICGRAFPLPRIRPAGREGRYEINNTMKNYSKFFQDLEKRPPDKNARINVVLSEIIQKNYEFEVVYADPPFNTVKSEDQRNVLDQFSLKEELYNV